MRIISNTTPISELYKIGQLDLLKNLYGSICIAGDVLQELQRATALPDLYKTVAAAAWIMVYPVSDPGKIQALLTRYSYIHKGEAATIALAQELGAQRIIMDEKRGRRAVQAEGLPLIGTIGVVLLAQRLQRIDKRQAVSILEDLYNGTAYISTELYDTAIRQLQAQPD